VARIVITSWGSYGDLYPYIGLGRALAAVDHHVTLAVPAYYAPVVADAGLHHAAVGPEIDSRRPGHHRACHGSGSRA
jgi:UDP:flavonoid glycosyltransferase YjiC (YdhE family)